MRLAGALVAVEGLIGIGFAAYFVVQASSASLSMRAVLGASAMFVVLGAIVVAIGVGLVRGRGWSRTPGILVQALLLPTAFSLLGPSGRVAIGVLVVAYALVTLTLLLGGPAKRWSVDLDEARRDDARRDG